MCKFYEYSVLEVELQRLSLCVTTIHRYEFGFHPPFAL